MIFNGYIKLGLCVTSMHNFSFKVCIGAVKVSQRSEKSFIYIILPLPLFWGLFCAEVGAG